MKSDLDRRRWPVTSLCVLRDALAARQVDIAPYLAAAGLPAALLSDPAAEVLASAELRVISAMLGDLGDPPGLGLHVGQYYRVAAYGVWGFALLASATLRSALALGLEYQDLTYSVMPIAFVDRGEGSAVNFDDRDLPQPLRRYMVERDIAAARRIASDLWGEAPACQGARFRFAEPAGLAGLYESALQCPVEFDAGANEILYGQDDLDRPLPQANPVVASLHVEACHERLRRLRGQDPFVETVTACILARPGHFPDLPEVAAELRLSERSLRRRLAEAGIGYRDLVARLRQDLAIDMLTETGMAVEAVAERLGYAETASFTHAFRRWTGQSPSRFGGRRPPRSGALVQ